MIHGETKTEREVKRKHVCVCVYVHVSELPFLVPVCQVSKCKHFIFFIHLPVCLTQGRRQFTHRHIALFSLNENGERKKKELQAPWAFKCQFFFILASGREREKDSKYLNALNCQYSAGDKCYSSRSKVGGLLKVSGATRLDSGQETPQVFQHRVTTA